MVAETLRSHPFPGSNSLGAVVPDISGALSARDGKGVNSGVDQGPPLIVHALRAEGFDASEDGTGRGTPLVAVDLQQITHPENGTNPRVGDPAPSLAARSRVAAYNVYPARGHGSELEARATDLASSCTSVGPDRNERGTRVAGPLGVRRLTPRECERLMGFPDDYTLVPYRGKPAKDGPRYAALGNSWAVPVVRWIGERIELVDGLLSEHMKGICWRSGYG